jgi:hypothetical protein
MLYVILFPFYERSTLKTSCQPWKIRATPHFGENKNSLPIPMLEPACVKKFSSLVLVFVMVLLFVRQSQ